MRFGKTEKQKENELQAREWAYTLGVKRFVWWPISLESGEIVWLETIVQQWNALFVESHDGEAWLEGLVLKTHSLKEWDTEGYDNHELFVESCPTAVKNLIPKRYPIAKLPKNGKSSAKVFNMALGKKPLEEILSGLSGD